MFITRFFSQENENDNNTPKDSSGNRGRAQTLFFVAAEIVCQSDFYCLFWSL